MQGFQRVWTPYNLFHGFRKTWTKESRKQSNSLTSSAPPSALCSLFTAAFLSVARYKKRDLYHDFCHNKSLAFSLDTDAFASADGFKPTFRCFATPFLLIEEGISFLFPPVKSRADKLRIPS
jgi:hypothetical protein